MPNDLARKTDPRSSHEAAAELKAKGIQREQQSECLLMLATHGQGTRAEIATKETEKLMSGKRGTHNHEIAKGMTYQTTIKLGRRLPELAKEGLIELVEIRKCTIVGRACQVWRCTGIGLAAASMM